MTKFFIAIFLFLSIQSNAQSFDELNTEFMELFEKGDYKAAVPIGLRSVAQAKKESGELSENYAIASHNLAAAYNELEQYTDAMPYYLRADKAYTTFFKTSANASSALCKNSIGNIYLLQNKYDSAGIYYEKAWSYFITQPKDQYDNLIVLMNNFTQLYLPRGNYKEARKIYEMILPVIEKQEGISTDNDAVTVSNLISTLYNLQEYVLAETHIKKALQVIEKMKGTANTSYTELLDMWANCARELGRFNESVEINLKSLKIKQAFELQDTTALAYSYAGLANVYGDMGDYNKAFSHYQTALAMLEYLGLQETVDYISIKKSFAYTLLMAVRLVEAKALLSSVLQAQTKLFGGDYGGNGEILISMASVETQLNELSAAEEHAVEGLVLTIKNYGDQHYAVAKAKEVLGLVYHRIGNSAKGITSFKEALEINNKIFGTNSYHNASVLSNLGLVYQDIGNLAEAEIALSNSVEIRKKIYGVEHPDYALALSNLAMVYVHQALYTQADKMLADALQIYLKKDLGHSNNLVSLINNIAFMAEKQGNIAEAKNVYTQLLQILEANPSKNIIGLYTVVNNLSIIHMQDGNYKDALMYATKAMDYAKENQGIRSLEYIKSMNNNLIIHLRLGNIERAKLLFDELIPLCKDVMGDDASILGLIYFNRATLEDTQKNFEQAANYMDLAFKIFINDFKKNFYTLSEKEKLTWWQDQSAHFAAFPVLLENYHISNGPLVSSMVNHQLQLKGFVLNDASSALRKARNSGNASLKKLLDQWQLNKTLLSKQLALPMAERNYPVDSLELIANNLEKAINQQAAGLINVQTNKSTTWQSIQSSLKQGEAAVEFMRFPLFRNNIYTDTMQYAAIIIRKERSSPDFVLLGNEKQIEWCLTGGKEDAKEIRINNLYRATLGKKNTTFAGDSLYNLIWKPLMPYLENIQTVMYAPDGLLHKVAFQALPYSTNKMLIDTLQLQQYTSIRQVSEKNAGTEKWNSAFLLGNADFNNANTSSSTSNTVNVTFAANRSVAAAWSALPGTEKEIKTLQPLLTAKGLKVSAANGSKASEEAFKSLDGKSPSIIHLATHGFFLPDPEIKSNSAITATTNSYALSDEPLMRSGIIMAGANRAWSGEKIKTGEDGIVTAYEIAQLNLSATKLVVLSACETALGDLKGSEGVFGLQRAFKIAGVKNLIVSLWQVPDKETAELMTSFYNHLLNGVTAREALYKSQKEMRSKYPPFSWAAFVLVE